jgi:hypothetical protein
VQIVSEVTEVYACRGEVIIACERHKDTLRINFSNVVFVFTTVERKCWWQQKARKIEIQGELFQQITVLCIEHDHISVFYCGICIEY